MSGNDADSPSTKAHTAKQTPTKIQLGAFIALVVQNTLITLFTHNTRAGKPENQLYLPSTAVVLAECIKLFICAVVDLIQRYNNHHQSDVATLFNRLKVIIDCVIDNFRISFNPGPLISLSFPSLLYVIQNNTLYVALEHLDISMYHVLSSLKLLTTALFSVILLNKRLSNLKWVSLVILCIGISLAQLPNSSSQPDVRDVDGRTDGMVALHNDDDSIISSSFLLTKRYSIGVLSVFVASITSGLAGCWFEKVSKSSTYSSETANPTTHSTSKTNSPPTIWQTNIHLTIPSLIFAISRIIIDAKDFPIISQKGFFHGYDYFVYSVIFLQAIGGLLVALLVHYSNSIIKGYATSFGIIISTMVSTIVSGQWPSFTFIIGSFLVAASTVLFGYASS